MSWLRKPGPVSKLAPGADPRPPRPKVPPAPPAPSARRSRPGIAEYTPRTVPAPPPPPPTAGDCPGTPGEPLPHPTVLALRRDLQHARDAYAGEHGILLAEPTELTRAQQIRVHALTAARILATGRGDLDQQAAAVLEVAARFETWIRDGDTQRVS